MARREFTTKTRKQALKRSGLRCEAVGSWYGLPDGQRCPANLGDGVEYDHLILDANSKDNSLENCRAVCPKCHRWKTANRDTPTAAKTVRQQFSGLKTKAKAKIPSAPKPPRPAPKAMPPRRSLYQEITHHD
ncbi:MAG: HNH endonuclease signature motif containing protein [Rhizobiaceae bacterium]